MDPEKQKYLNEIYFNPKKAASFSGINKLFHHVQKKRKFKFTREEIAKWLQSQEIHTTNRLVQRKRFKRRVVIAPYIDYMWDIDTASLKNYAKKNKQYGYFVLAIDIMSRFIWTIAIKTPSGEEIVKALKTFFKTGRVPELLRSDQGTEFKNEKVKKVYEVYNINHFVTQNEVKANYAERAIQTIKSKLVRYMRSKQTHKWIDALDDVTTAYNNTFHRSIRQTPGSVTKKDEVKLWKLLYNQKSKRTSVGEHSFKFNINDVVRISRLRQSFQRYYSEHWSNELFIIRGRSMKQYIPTYTLTDYGSEPITGIFYESELQKVFVDENTTYRIEKVLKQRTMNRRKESLVKWLGWPTKFNSWIPTKDILSYKK